MIISHQHKFIFLRTEKTAGTAISAALAEKLAEGDEIITACSDQRTHRIPGRRLHPGGLKRTFPRLFGLHFHAKAKQVRAALGKAVFDNYYKFAVERNPWDRQVSLYYHRALVENYQRANFDRDMSSALYRAFYYSKLHNWDIYSISDRVVVDRVLRYERLAEEIPTLCAQIGLSDITLQRLNPGRGGERRHYSTFYTDRTRELVGRWYRREIEQFGYSFEAQ